MIKAFSPNVTHIDLKGGVFPEDPELWNFIEQVSKRCINLREIDLTFCIGMGLVHVVTRTVKKRWEQTKGSMVTDTDLYHELHVQMPMEGEDSSLFSWARDYLEREGPYPHIIVEASLAPERNALPKAVETLDGPMVAFLTAFAFFSPTPGVTNPGEGSVLFRVRDKHILTAAAKGELQLLDLLV
jgi:hypothetical protein